MIADTGDTRKDMRRWSSKGTEEGRTAGADRDSSAFAIKHPYLLAIVMSIQSTSLYKVPAPPGSRL